MALTSGTRLGVYEVTALIGEGGMGQVYRARDTKLDRDVAIKILPAAFAHDAERVARFTREAKTLASLNHPNIAHIHGLEESGGITALVMELVEGDDLSQRIARGAIPIDEVLPIAKQIAEALEAAHEQGIIHRDLKPANIKVRADGTVKVLDFGLAKAMEPAAGSSPRMSMSPTMMSPAQLSGVGVILGTAAYMSPEQAKGRVVDKRSDLWAFGCVLYEMLTGKPAFDGEGITEILSRVLQREPDWTKLPAGVPSRVRELLQLCLEKNVKNRRSDATDVRLDIEHALKESGTVALPAAVPVNHSRLAWIAAAILALALTSLATVYLRQKSAPDLPEMRVEITTPSTSAPSEFALSPDGRHIAFVASGDGPQRLWLRALDKNEARPIPGTEGADYPFWSADNRSVGFFAAGKLVRIDISGGAPQVLASAPLGFGGSWNAVGTILFATFGSGPLSRIAASGGEPVAVTRVDSPRQVGHRFPQFLPDHRHFLFYAQGNPEMADIYLGSLMGAAPKRLTAADTPGAFLQPDMVVFVRSGTLVAWHLDLKREELAGDPINVASDLAGFSEQSAGISVSSDGRLAYRASSAGSRHFVWYDRTGKMLGVAGESDVSMGSLELSPDDRRVAFHRTVEHNVDIWLMDLIRGGLTRFTFDPAPDRSPLWSSDGTRIAFASDRNRNGTLNLYVKASNGAGAEALLLETLKLKIPQDWSKDGRFLLYFEIDPKTGRDLWALPITGTAAKPIVVANTPFEERVAQFSPDSHWVAYETNESGRFEIAVQAFPQPGGKWQVSTNGGVQPRWRADGKELYFIAPDGKLMAVTVAASGSTFEAGTPTALFPARVVGGGDGIIRPQYAVARDGQFLINQPVEASTATPITLILNWKPPVK